MNSIVGLGLRHEFQNYVLEHKPAVPWFEVITENYLLFGGAPRSFLKKIRELYPLVFHGVSLSIGSQEAVRLDYLKHLKNLIHEFKPLWVSDHLCWTYNGRENSHDLLPVPLTKNSLNRIITKTQQVQDYLGQKIYLENPSAYINFAANEYKEEDFINQLCQKSGCGLLLDLNNLVVNQYNLNYDPLNYLNTVKNCDVRQIHLAGHSVKENVRIDTHDHDISPEVIDLISTAKTFWPEAQPMIEWDDKIPPIDYLLSKRQEIEDIWQQASGPKNEAKPNIKNNSLILNSSKSSTSDDPIHQNFWKLLKKNDYITPAHAESTKLFDTTSPTPAHVGMNVYSSGYYNRLIEVLGKDFPVLKIVLNEVFSDVMTEYLTKYPSIYDSIDFAGNRLSQFIAEHEFSYDLGVDKKIIADVAAFENLGGLCSVSISENFKDLSVTEFSETDWIERKLKLKSTVLIYKSHSEIHPVIHAVKNDAIPEIPNLDTVYYVFFTEDNKACFKIISEDEYKLFLNFSEFNNFVEIIEKSQINFEKSAALLFQNEKFFCTDVLPN